MKNTKRTIVKVVLSVVCIGIAITLAFRTPDDNVRHEIAVEEKDMTPVTTRYILKNPEEKLKRSATISDTESNATKTNKMEDAIDALSDITE